MKAERRKVRWGLLALLLLVLAADAMVGCWFRFGKWDSLGPLAWVYFAAFVALGLSLIAHLDREARTRW